ncbi:hypothetical protein [Microbacterium candidum]|uniref:Cell division protein FtsL n=1 Tax=Microbacterium candidum TaxID=3041922 RepID=A0ABT7N3X1_9MICO|nr:hypothetical protein [Microbacterium sp. ASV49]MDL9981410.1 hypothetical protein [Microbacterium sp. ASV49]
MTTATSAAASPLRAPRRAPQLPEERGQRLHAVAPRVRRRRPRIVYAMVAIAGVLAIGAAQMTLSILTTESTFAVSKLTQQQRTLTLQKQVLYDEVTGLSSPQFLAANASALGMVVGQPPSYLRLSDGALLGNAAPSTWVSSVDVRDRGSVPNALIANTPLVTDPALTAGDRTAPPATDATTGAGTTDGATGTDATPPPANPATPPALTDGLPSPSTH